MKDIAGNLTSKIQFDIDQKSWKNLDNFQRRLGEIKKQMQGLSANVKINAVVNQITAANNKIANNQVANVQKVVKAQKKAVKEGYGLEFGRATGADRNYAAWWSDALKGRDKKPNRAPASASNDSHITAFKAQQKASMQAQRRQSEYERLTEIHTRTKLSQANNYGIRAGLTGDKGYQAEQAALYKKLESIRATSSSLQDAKQKMNAVTNEMLNMDRAARKNALSFGTLRTAIVQMTAAYTAFSGIQNIAQTGMSMESLRAGALVFAGDQKGVEEHMTFIADEAERLGTNFEVSAKEFTKFSIATKNKVSKSAGREIFSGVSEYAAVLQVDQQQFERAFKSINQIK